MALEWGEIEASGTGGRQPALRIPLKQGIATAGVGGDEQLKQKARGPVFAGGIEAIETIIKQGQQLGDSVLQLGQLAAALTDRTGKETLEQLISGNATGDR
jgi:hypothetical protein